MDAKLRPAGLAVAFNGGGGAADCPVARLAGAAGLVSAEGGGAGIGFGASRRHFCLWHAVVDGRRISRVWSGVRIISDRLDRAGGDLSLQPDCTNGAI